MYVGNLVNLIFCKKKNCSNLYGEPHSRGLSWRTYSELTLCNPSLVISTHRININASFFFITSPHAAKWRLRNFMIALVNYSFSIKLLGRTAFCLIFNIIYGKKIKVSCNINIFILRYYEASMISFNS